MGRQQFLQFAQQLAGIKKFPDPSSGQAGPICFGGRCRRLIAQPIARLLNAVAQRTVQDRSEGFVRLERPAQHWRPLAVAASAELPTTLINILPAAFHWCHWQGPGESVAGSLSDSGATGGPMAITHKNGRKRKKALGCIKLALTIAPAVFCR